MSAPAQERITVARRVGYGVGCFGTDIYWQSTSFFLLFYYTDVVGLPASTAGFIYMAALVWDGLIDPVMGVIANRTRTRFGRYRPYILFASPALALSFVAMFVRPDLGETGLVVYALVTHVIFRTGYTVVSIPYNALSAQMTGDSHERSGLAAARVMFGTLAGFGVALASLPLVRLLGGGSAVQGYLMMSIVYALLSLIAFAITFVATREVPVDANEIDPPLASVARMLWTNRPFLIVVLAIIAASIGSVFTSKTLVYFCKYRLGDEELAGNLFALLVGTIVVLTPAWVQIAKRTSKRFVWMAGGLISATASLLLWNYDGQDTRVVGAIFLLSAIGASGIPFTFWSMIPDTVEYGEWRRGVRSEGAIFGLVSLAQKVALGVGVGAVGMALDATGYHPNAVQAASTVEGLHAMVGLVPAFCSLTAVALITFYPIDGRTHGRIARVLERRRLAQVRSTPAAQTR